MSSIIEVKDLNLWYGAHHALHSVNIDIPEHEITALIGPSGCGKSTFLKTLDRMNDFFGSVSNFMHSSGSSLTVALYVYARERAEFDVAFAIAAILMLLTLIINLAASLVGRKLKKK